MPPKTHKVVVLGAKGTGKTGIIQQAIYGDHIIGSQTIPTIEDIYMANVLSERGMEHLRLHDTAGLDDKKPEIPKHYFSSADAYILVYDITKWESFHCLNAVKADIEKNKDKKEMPVILVLGNKLDLENESRQLASETVLKWANKEKVHVIEVSVNNRKGLLDAFQWLASKLTPAPQKSSLSIKNHFRKATSTQGSTSVVSAVGPAADV